MTARDELAEAIMQHPWLEEGQKLYAGICPSCPNRQIHGGHNSPSHATHIADAILAAGYSKPRTVSTVAELDALATESVVRCAAGMVFEKYPDDEGPEFDFWLMVGESRAKPSTRITLPATVLYEPTLPHYDDPTETGTQA